MEDDYVVMDIETRKLLTRILISKEEAEVFMKLTTNKNARIFRFGWYQV